MDGVVWEDGPAETLTLQATRINGPCPPPNHGSHADRRLGMVEIEFGVFLTGLNQDGSSAGACHLHCIVTVWPRRQGTATAMGEIEAVELIR